MPLYMYQPLRMRTFDPTRTFGTTRRRSIAPPIPHAAEPTDNVRQALRTAGIEFLRFG